jgi:hypothetical protein
MIVSGWDLFFYNFKLGGMNGTFIMQDRYYFFLLLLALCLAAAIKNRNYKYLIMILQGVFVYFMVDDMRSGHIMPGIPFFILFALSIASMLYVLIKEQIFENKTQAKFIVLSVSFIFLFYCFCALNFFTPRYLFIALVPLLFFVAVLMDKMIQLTHRMLFYPALLLILVISFFTFKNDDSWGDCNIGAFDGIKVQQKVVDYFEDRNYYDKVIACGSYLEQQNLRVLATGYLRHGKVFKNVSWHILGHTDYATFDNINPDYRIDEIKKDTSFKLIHRIQEGKVWAEIYGRK